jgi:hypothetical protein
MHFLDHKIKILLHCMIGHEDWNQYQHLLPSLKAAKRQVQDALKPGGGGPSSTNIGRISTQKLLILGLKVLFGQYFTLYVLLRVLKQW